MANSPMNVKSLQYLRNIDRINFRLSYSLQTFKIVEPCNDERATVPVICHLVPGRTLCVFFFILSTTLILKIKQYMFTRYMNIDWHLNRTNLYLLAISFLRRISRQIGTLPNFEVRVARRGNLKNHSKL